MNTNIGREEVLQRKLMIKKILIIWEEVPERTKFFLLSYDTTLSGARVDMEDHLKTLRICHSHFINLENTEEIDKALNALQGTVILEIPEHRADFIKEINLEELIECKPDYIFHMGFIM